MKKWVLFLLIFAAAFQARAEVAAGSSDKDTMTRQEAIQILFSTDAVKKKLGDLFSWTTGYDASKINRVRLTPTIDYIKVVPLRVPPDGRTIFEILAAVNDPGGIKNISGVRADLSPIGRLKDTTLFESSHTQLPSSAESVYKVETSVDRQVEFGRKDIAVSAANKKGWMALAKTSLIVSLNPTVVGTQIFPDNVVSKTASTITVVLRISNSGQPEDIVSVMADLRQFGIKEKMPFKAEGRVAAGEIDTLWSLQIKLPDTLSAGTYLIPVEAINLAGGVGRGAAELRVLK